MKAIKVKNATKDKEPRTDTKFYGNRIARHMKTRNRVVCGAFQDIVIVG